MTLEELHQIAELSGGLSNEIQALSTRMDKGFKRLEERFDRQEGRAGWGGPPGRRVASWPRSSGAH